MTEKTLQTELEALLEFLNTKRRLSVEDSRRVCGISLSVLLTGSDGELLSIGAHRAARFLEEVAKDMAAGESDLLARHYVAWDDEIRDAQGRPQEQPVTLSPPRCTRCDKSPHELAEYHERAAELGLTLDEYVRREEGTYNPKNNLFACTSCYLALGMPSAQGPRGWKAGDLIQQDGGDQPKE